jgi:hypothetical protein
MSEYITKKKNKNKLGNLGRGLGGIKGKIMDYEPEFFNLKDSDLKIVLPSKKYKKGGLVTKGKPKLAKKGWK